MTKRIIIALLIVISINESLANICEGVTDFAKVPHPEDCGSYYLCYTDSLPLLIVCAGDHHFNVRTGFCDLPEDAQCTIGQETTTELTTTIVTTTINPLFPNCNSSVVSWEPNINSCTKYFICFHGNPVERSCAPGELFLITYLLLILDLFISCI